MPSHAQTDEGVHRSLLEVIISKYEGEKVVDNQQFRFRLAFDQQGSLRVATTPPVVAAEASASCLATQRPEQFIGRQVDAVVSPAAGGKFKIHLVVNDRSFVGCRRVGDVEIPVYSNRTASHDLVLNDGGVDEVQMDLDRTAGMSTRVRVAVSIVAK